MEKRRFKQSLEDVESLRVKEVRVGLLQHLVGPDTQAPLEVDVCCQLFLKLKMSGLRLTVGIRGCFYKQSIAEEVTRHSAS